MRRGASGREPRAPARAVHRPRHLDVREHQAHVVGARFQDGKGFVRGGGRERLNPASSTMSTAISRRSSSSSTTRMARFALVIVVRPWPVRRRQPFGEPLVTSGGRAPPSGPGGASIFSSREIVGRAPGAHSSILDRPAVAFRDSSCNDKPGPAVDRRDACLRLMTSVVAKSSEGLPWPGKPSPPSIQKPFSRP